jgi:hypothetical protein
MGLSIRSSPVDQQPNTVTTANNHSSTHRTAPPQLGIALEVAGELFAQAREQPPDDIRAGLYASEFSMIMDRTEHFPSVPPAISQR